MKYVIIHGTFGNPDENRFPWLKTQLASQGHQVWVPRMSTPVHQTPEKWCEELQSQVPFVFDEETVLIGHSLGATYLLHVLDRDREVPVHKAIFVSGFANTLGNPVFDELNAPFLKDFDWARIKKNVGEIHIFHGDNDPYVSTDHARFLHQQLGGELHMISQGGHLNEAAGYDRFEELLAIL